MPELRDDLGRLADYVGEPRGLDDLAAARRRRERRRRAEGLVVGLAVIAAAAVFLATTFRSGPGTDTPGDASPSVSTSGSVSTYVDPMGWTIDVPASWVVAPIDGSDGQFTYTGAIFASAQPQPEPLTPTAFTLPPGAVSLEIYNVAGELYDCTHKDSAFPLAFQDFELPAESDQAGGIYGRFWGGGCQFTLSGSSSADATPEQNDTLRRMVASIRFEPDASQTQSPDAISCGTKPIAQPTIVGKDIALTGCTYWRAGDPIDIRFEVRDAGIPMGLELFSPSSCDQNGCAGKALWAGDLIVGRDTTTYHLDPLDAGSYVLVDAVHPVSARLIVIVG